MLIFIRLKAINTVQNHRRVNVYQCYVRECGADGPKGEVEVRLWGLSELRVRYQCLGLGSQYLLVLQYFVKILQFD